MWSAHVEACELVALCITEQTGLRAIFTARGEIIVEDAIETRPRFRCSYSEDGAELFSTVTIGSDQIKFVGPPARSKISEQVAAALASPRSSFMRTVRLVSTLKCPRATPADLNPAALRAKLNAPE